MPRPSSSPIRGSTEFWNIFYVKYATAARTLAV